MIGKSLMEYRFGPAATLARHLGWDNPAFFSDPIIARISIMSVQTTEYTVSEIRSPASFITSRVFIYGALVFWALICLFPIYWTITTSFKSAVDVTQGHLIPFVDFQPDWKGWRSLGLSPDSIFQTSTVRDEFFKRFMVASQTGSQGINWWSMAALATAAIAPLAVIGIALERYLIMASTAPPKDPSSRS